MSCTTHTGDGEILGFGGRGGGGAFIPTLGITVILHTDDASPASFLAVILYSPSCRCGTTEKIQLRRPVNKYT